MTSIPAECPLTNTEVLALCKEFTSITNTNTDLSMMILQQNQWNLEHAVNAYLDLVIDKSKSSIKKLDDQYHSESTKMKTHFKLFSWNIDGLDKHALEIRTQGVIDIIKKLFYLLF